MKLKIAGVDFTVHADRITFEGGTVKSGADANMLCAIFRGFADRKLNEKLFREELDTREGGQS